MNELLDCGHAESAHSDITVGYGTDSDGKKHCYACCADRDRAQMIADGKTTLYLVERNGGKFITNWPASLEFKVYHVNHSRTGGGFGSQRTDAYFTGPDGKRWHAINRGDMQIARCHRMKSAY